MKLLTFFHFYIKTVGDSMYAYTLNLEAKLLVGIKVLSMGKAFATCNLIFGYKAVKFEETGLFCSSLDLDDLAKQVIHMLKTEKKHTV